MDTCATNPACQFRGQEVIGGVTYNVYFCTDSDQIEKYPEEESSASAPIDEVRKEKE